MKMFLSVAAAVGCACAACVAGAKDSAGAVRGAGGVAVVNGVTHLYSRTVGNKIYHLNDEGAQVVLLHFRCAT